MAKAIFARAREAISNENIIGNIRKERDETEDGVLDSTYRETE
jgi:hypothetical protein